MNGGKSKITMQQQQTGCFLRRKFRLGKKSDFVRRMCCYQGETLCCPSLLLTVIVINARSQRSRLRYDCIITKPNSQLPCSSIKTRKSAPVCNADMNKTDCPSQLVHLLTSTMLQTWEFVPARRPLYEVRSATGISAAASNWWTPGQNWAVMNNI